MINKNLWVESLSIGEPVVDSQHKELIISIEKFRQACKVGYQKSEIMDMIEYLEYYTFSHFEYEEEIQMIISFPGYHRHKIIHSKFLDYVDSYSNKIKNGSFNLALLMELNKNLSMLIIDHIKKEDRLIGDFLKCDKISKFG